MPLPLDGAITLIAIDAVGVLTFGETLTPGVAAAVPRAGVRIFPFQEHRS